MTKLWQATVGAVGVLALVAIGMSSYALLTLNDRVNDGISERATELRASRGEPGPQGPVGPEGPEGPEGPQGPPGVAVGCEIDSFQWSQFEDRIESAITSAIDQATRGFTPLPQIRSVVPPSISCR